MALNLADGQRAERKELITVVEWEETAGSKKREIAGRRVPDSSIDLNADLETSTDILGITYTDVNKTEPSQTFDPASVMGGSAFAEYLYTNAIENNIKAYNNVFTVYIISAFIGNGTDGYKAVKHEGCTIVPTSIGGESHVDMPFEIHFSNNITKGSVDKLTDDFVFTADA